MTQLAYKRISNICKYFLIFAILYVITFSCISCESKSGQLAKQPAKPMEKVVIIDSYEPEAGTVLDGHGRVYQYKIKRLSKGVVDVIYDPRLLEQGDTILRRFQD